MIKPRDGFWHADLRLPNGKRIRQSTKVLYPGNRLEAMKEHDRIEREALEALTRVEEAGGLTMQGAFDQALVDREKWRDADTRTLEATFKAVCHKWPATGPVSAIIQDEATEWLRGMVRQGLAPSTINSRISMVNVLCDQAKVPRPKLQRRSPKAGRIRTVSEAEEKDILAFFEGVGRQDMADLVKVLLDTGFRLSEALRITWRDVDFVANTVACWVNKADEPRIIPMTTRVRAVLSRRLSPAWVTHAFATCVDRAEDQWNRVRRHLKLTEDSQFVLHALRHTCATRLAQAGVDAHRIKVWMGHKSVTTTERYVNLFGPQLGALARVLERAHGGTIDPSNEPSPAGEDDRVPGRVSTVNPQVPGSSPGRGAKPQQGLTTDPTAPGDPT